MSKQPSVVSLKRAITSAILFVGIMTLALSVGLTTWSHNKQLTKESERFITAIGDILAYGSAPLVDLHLPRGLEEFLSTLKGVSDVSNIHIYKRNEITNELEFFSGYERHDILPIPDQISILGDITRPRFTEDYVEYAVPIVQEASNQELGFIYLRLDLASYNQNLSKQAKYNALIAFVVSLLAYVLAQYLRYRILAPIKYFASDIERATHKSGFDYTLKPIQFQELQVVRDAVNELLTKINKQLVQTNAAEHEIKELNQNLESKVVHRTKALRDSNQELLDALEQVHQYQSQVIESEKMASLGQMVAGVAHEVNTPIGLGVTASTMLADKIENVQQSLEDKKLTATQLQKFLSESKENTQIIYRNLTRAADLISSFKQVAVDQTAGSIRNINVNEYLHEIITSMQPTLKRYRHEIEIKCDPDIFIKTKPGPINQIVINLVMNSIIHAFKGMEQGKITITATLTNHRCYLDYDDDGCGIEEKIKNKVFDPFVTTNRGDGGSGLGLHLVYNLVTQALKGKISVQSELGHGAKFNIEFPSELEERL